MKILSTGSFQEDYDLNSISYYFNSFQSPYLPFYSQNTSLERTILVAISALRTVSSSVMKSGQSEMSPPTSYTAQSLTVCFLFLKKRSV